MADDPHQLDLTEKITEVPQANNLALFVRLMSRVHAGVVTIGELTEREGVEARTIHYYVDFARWLGFLREAAPGEVALSEAGRAFVESRPARGRLFARAIFARPLVQSINALKRDSQNDEAIETIDTREAAYRAIAAMSELSESTARRRASGLAQMLDAAYRPSRIDWETGESLAAYTNVAFDFEGRTFLTAMAARQFGPKRTLRVGFPKQVRAFVEQRGHGMHAGVWGRASYDSADGSASWFGSVPVGASTQEIAERGGRDLRKLITVCAPYVTLAVAMLTYRDPTRRPSVRLTHDMYGLRFWEHDREIGAPMEVLGRFARALELEPAMQVDQLPPALRRGKAELLEPGDDADLVATLLGAGLVREKDTTYTLVPGLEDELREGSESTPSVAERMAPLQAVLRELFEGDEAP